MLGGHIVLAQGGQFCWYLQKEGKKKNDIIDTIKSFSIELNDALIHSCISIQSAIEVDNGISSHIGRVSIKEAARIFAVTSVTIRNYINDKENPLGAQNFGRRKTTILLKDLNDYMSKLGKPVKLKV